MNTVLLIPNNFHKIDNLVSRSAQIKKENIPWLKENGVTDVINFRTMIDPAINFDEEKILKENKIRYHNIPSISNSPTDENVKKFLTIIENVKKQKGKVHIHCKQGADRTGMYSYIYERLYKISLGFENIMELFHHGYHYDKYPDLVTWADMFVKRTLK